MLNVVRLDLPSLKSTIKVNLGGGVVATELKDANDNSEIRPSFIARSSIGIEFRPDSRWDFDFSYGLDRLSKFNSSFTYQNNFLEKLEFNIAFRPKKEQINQVFYRLAVIKDSQKEDFLRFQVGYSFPLLRAK